MIHCYGCDPPRPATLRGKNWSACDQCALYEHSPYNRITRWQRIRLVISEWLHRLASRVAGEFWK